MTQPEAPIYSRSRFVPPSQLQGATLRQSIVADGCHIGNNVTIENSVIGLRCMIGDNVTIRNSVLMGADYLETSDELARLTSAHPRLGVGSGSLIEGAIVDKNCRIGQNVEVRWSREESQADFGDVCSVRDGIPVVVKGSTLPDGWRMA